jgi:hypothetical protein
VAEWLLRWIIIPGKITPYAMASAQWGWRIPFRKIIRLLLNWRWWPAVVLAALLGVVLPGHFFSGVPHGTVTHQIWAVSLKVALTYVLGVASGVLLLGWAAVMMGRSDSDADAPDDEEMIPVEVGLGPLGSDQVKLPLPEDDEGAGGNI